MRYKSALPLFLCVGLLSPAALAQGEDSVIVTGTRLPVPLDKSGISVSVLGASDLEAMGYAFVADALQAAPGITVNENGAFGGTATVRIRGALSEQTLVLIDGVPVNDPTSPGGGFNFANLDRSDIERIEILRGPQSTLWGSDAIGGVVNIITKTPEKGVHGLGFAEYGSFNTAYLGAAASAAGEAGHLRLSLSSLSSDGISKADEDYGNSEEDGYDSLAFGARGGLALPYEAFLRASFRYVSAENQYDTTSFVPPFRLQDSDDKDETEEMSGSAMLSLPLFDGALENQLSAGYSQITRDIYSGGSFVFGSEGERMVYRYQANVTPLETARAALGAEREETTSNGTDSWINSIFALGELTPLPRLTLSAGIRLDDHKTFGEETAGRAGFIFALSDEWSLHANWGEGFKAPTLFQTSFFCCGATGPNTGLEPERSEAYEIGLDWRRQDGKAAAKLTYFDQDTENLILFAAGSYFNVARATSEGFEAEGDILLTEFLRLSAAYTHLDAVDDTGQDLVGLPQHAADVTLLINPDGAFHGALMAHYNSEKRDFTGGTVGAWTRLDATVSYRIGNGVELYGLVENLTDEDYQYVLDYGTPGLSGRAGIRLSL